MFLNNFPKIKSYYNNSVIDVLSSSNKELLIYGAGTYAYVLYKYLSSKSLVVSNFIVDEIYKHSDTYLGVNVETFESISKNINDYDIVIGITNYPKVTEIFKRLNFKSFYVIDVPDFLNVNKAFIDFEYIKYNSNKFERAYHLFDDSLSQKTFVASLNTKLSSDLSHLLPYVELDHLYFTKEIIKQTCDHVLLDVGGFNGDSIKDFVRITNNNFKYIISLEPFEKNFNLLNKTIYDLEINNKCTSIQIGAWNKNEVLSFSNTELDIDNRIISNGNLKINVDTIDSITQNISEDFTILKFDINGSEYNALIGAKETINKYKPFLAIKIQTKEDFYRIPLFLKETFPSISLKLRQRNYMSMMLVLYACFQ